MIKHIIKIIWNERRSNGWIFTELLVVVAVLWVMMDSLLVDAYTYHSPLGFNIEDTYRVNLDKLSAGMPGYVPDSLLPTSTGEDVLRLVENMKKNPQVEALSFGVASCPYSENNSWSSLIRSDADSTEKALTFQQFSVTPEYFALLRIKSKEGKPLLPIIEQSGGKIVVTSDLEERLFKDGIAMGKSVKFGSSGTNVNPIAAVSGLFRTNEYKKHKACYFVVNERKDIEKKVNDGYLLGMDCLLRMKPGFKAEEMESFLQSLGDRLTVNNVYVDNVTPLSEMRTKMLKGREDNMKKKSALVGFMLLNVFFGIVGTFWLRTQQRRGEMGLRMALGSGHGQLQRFLRVEGLSLLLLTLPFVLLFILNMLYFDLPDTYRLEYTWWRFALTLAGAYGLMAGMISLGIWMPTHKVIQMAPAEAL
ncbi:MAG: ABC transporter permease, partial [Tannerellaceae bacterium]